MAAPHVSGTLGLLLAEGLDARTAVSRVLETVDHNVSCGANSPTCHGRLDTVRAVGGQRDR